MASPELTPSVTTACSAPDQASISEAGSPSCSSTVTPAGTLKRSRRATSRPAASSRRIRLPIPIKASSGPLLGGDVLEGDVRLVGEGSRLLDVLDEVLTVAFHHAQGRPLVLEEQRAPRA